MAPARTAKPTGTLSLMRIKITAMEISRTSDGFKALNYFLSGTILDLVLFIVNLRIFERVLDLSIF